METNRTNITFKTLTDPNDILKYLPIGINIPIWTEFHKYILHDLNYFKAKSIILEEEGNPLGNVLVYSDNKKILYFGYFGIINHNEKYISWLIDKLANYAQENNFKLIQGPINIPTVIYGWGFMQKGSSENLFIGKPVNPPVYQELFLKKGFYVKIEEKTWEGPYLKFNPYRLKKYDYSNYEYFNPKDLEEFIELKWEFLRVNANNMPESGVITPSIAGLFDNYADFVFKYGHNFMIIFIRYKPTGKIVACSSCLPNPFRTDDKGNYNSIVAYTWAIDSEHRGKGLTFLIWGATSLQTWKKKLKYTSIPAGIEGTKHFKKFAKFVNLQNTRAHLILELRL